MNVYLKVWRYRDGVFQYRSSSFEDEDLDPEDVKLSVFQKARLKENDWLIQKLPASRRGRRTTQVKAAEVSALLSDANIPASAQIWHWDGRRVRLTYTRRSSSLVQGDDEVRAEVEALCDDDQEMVILYCGGEEGVVHPIYRPLEDRWEYASVERRDQPLSEGQPASGGIFDDDDRLLVTLVTRLSKVQGKLRELDRAAREKESSKKKAKLAFEVSMEVIEGAEPAPVQGHNVVHSLDSVCKNLDKVISVCTGRQTLGEANETDGKTFSYAGGSGAASFGQGVSLVDGAWQAAGSLVAFVRSCIVLDEILHEDPEERSAKHGANAISRQALSMTTHVAKGVSTGAGIADAIMKVTAAAGAVPTQIVPAVGIITGLVSTVRSTVQAEKSRRRARRLRNVLAQNGGRGAIDPEVGDCIGYAMSKASRKHKFKAAEATVGAFGAVAATVLLVGAVVAGANAWNPVGWGIGALVFVAGAGLLIYKIWRKRTSRRRARKRGFSRKSFPAKVMNLFLEWFRTAPNSRETEVLAGVLEAYGVDPLALVMGGDREVEFAKARIDRHLA